MIEIKNLSKHFGPIQAVNNVSFSVARGEVLGFLGPNGAGKSTTMKMITGFLPPSSGTAVVCGHDVVENPLQVKSSIGYLPEGAPLYPDMTPSSFLSFIAEVRGLSGAEKEQRIQSAVGQVNLQGVMEQRIETLSKGFKRRVGLAQAILHDPPVLILDEPTDGLDPNQKHEVRGLIKNMAKNKAIVLSTHILEEVEAVCSRVIIISEGRVLIDEKPDVLLARSRLHNAVSLSVQSAASERVLVELNRMETIQSVEKLEQADGLVCFRVYPRNGKPILAEISERLRGANWQINDLRVETGRLDEVFRDLTQPASVKTSRN
jgi:ABC-2 type transport system ATP-binding protein